MQPQNLPSQDDTNNKLFNQFIACQINYETQTHQNKRKKSGIFFTNCLYTVDQVMNVINFNETIFSKKILEPSCGHGIFILKLLFKIYKMNPNHDYLSDFIANNLFFIDIDPEMIYQTKENINRLYNYLFSKQYQGKYNGFVHDFTYKSNCQQNARQTAQLSKLYGKIDYVIGNPPYITLYGRRSQKKSESQREYYLHQYSQFPDYVKNGKINYVMLFLEHSIEFLKYDGCLSFIIDMSFFETAYKYTRKYLLENTQINSIIYNIKNFEVASGQLIIQLTKKPSLSFKSLVKVTNIDSKEIRIYNQFDWYKDDDEYKFRMFNCEKSDRIISHIITQNNSKLKELYPQKNLRTCAMLLNMEEQFVFDKADLNKLVSVYPYYRGSKSLKEKFGALESTGFFYYDKKLQDKINDTLKQELMRQGIKNKKRIGLGEKIIYDYPKIYIRQSAKSLIATYDQKPSAANNSLYVFTLRDDSERSRQFLKFLCAYLNSELITFFCQKTQIIRYSKGKQPQIKISDLYSIPIPVSNDLISQLAIVTENFYSKKIINLINLLGIVNKLVYNYYKIDAEDILFIQKSIQSF